MIFRCLMMVVICYTGFSPSSPASVALQPGRAVSGYDIMTCVALLCIYGGFATVSDFIDISHRFLATLSATNGYMML
jgi:hypothetical protein